jgi:hypothetical protein
MISGIEVGAGTSASGKGSQGQTSGGGGHVVVELFPEVLVVDLSVSKWI